jgi:hypothetical protein
LRADKITVDAGVPRNCIHPTYSNRQESSLDLKKTLPATVPYTEVTRSQSQRQPDCNKALPITRAMLHQETRRSSEVLSMLSHNDAMPLWYQPCRATGALQNAFHPLTTLNKIQAQAYATAAGNNPLPSAPAQLRHLPGIQPTMHTQSKKDIADCYLAGS